MKGILYLLQVVVSILDAVVVMQKTARRETLEHQHIEHERLKRVLTAKKIQTEDARATQIENNAVLIDLKIEKLRNELGLDVPPFTPKDYE